MSILVIGLGNVLMRDEGIGVRVAEELECRYELPDFVEVIDEKLQVTTRECMGWYIGYRAA